LENDINELEDEKNTIESNINSGSISDYNELDKMSHKLAELNIIIEEKTLRWMELTEKIEN